MREPSYFKHEEDQMTKVALERLLAVAVPGC